ncbi:inosine/xanthosine triphosphatase [Candidatus Micrarchaeota archaeon]|nr:inosine/xanthosine triphosphatase [Candidatus Micrarchaeota archaeon]
MKHDLVAVGGSFETIHAGHEKLFEAAFKSGKKILLGLTTDEFIRKNKGKHYSTYEKRKKNLEKFIGKKMNSTEIFPLSDFHGPAAFSREIQAVIASEETEGRVRQINEMRKKNGLKQLELIIVPIECAEDLLPISCERIFAGKISRKGKRLKQIKITVGSANPTKVNGARNAARKIFKGMKIEVRGVKVDSGVHKQPYEHATIAGAVNRACAAFKKTNADYGIGLESGLFEFMGRRLDLQFCAVFDGKEATIGNSMGFEVPEKLMELIEAHDLDANEAFEMLTGVKNVGKQKGMIHVFSKGLAKREHMTEQALLCAFIPRIMKAKKIL